jgi:hypothetical protein
VSFAVVANQIIQLPKTQEEYPYNENYSQLSKTIFIFSALTTYDSYPDNQIIAVKNNLWIYGFFIAFVFLNLFFFVSIPTTILFNSFRDTRSKIILVD